MDTLPLSIANGWASGISAYATLLIAGLLGRAGAADTPVGAVMAVIAGSPRRRAGPP